MVTPVNVLFYVQGDHSKYMNTLKDLALSYDTSLIRPSLGFVEGEVTLGGSNQPLEMHVKYKNIFENCPNVTTSNDVSFMQY